MLFFVSQEIFALTHSRTCARMDTLHVSACTLAVHMCVIKTRP